jgi:hypothetical protein
MHMPKESPNAQPDAMLDHCNASMIQTPTLSIDCAGEARVSTESLECTILAVEITAKIL